MLDTWTCHVCGATRPDARISVYSTVRSLGGIEVKQNVRYCNDRPSCVEGAKNVNFGGGPSHYEISRESERG